MWHDWRRPIEGRLCFSYIYCQDGGIDDPEPPVSSEQLSNPKLENRNAKVKRET